MGVHASFWIMVSKYMPNSGTAGSHSSSVFSFVVLRSFHIILYSSKLVYISTNSVGGYALLHTLSRIYCL